MAALGPALATLRNGDGKLVDPPLATVVGGEGSNRCSVAAPARLCCSDRSRARRRAPAAAGEAAENSLSSVTPADGDTLGSSPTELVFTFLRELGADHTLTAGVTCDTQPQNTGVPQIGDNDERVVTVEILTPLPRGGCSVVWVLRDELEQPITEGRFAFSVHRRGDARRVEALDADQVAVHGEDVLVGGRERIARRQAVVGRHDHAAPSAVARRAVPRRAHLASPLE